MLSDEGVVRFMGDESMEKEGGGDEINVKDLEYIGEHRERVKKVNFDI